VPQTFRHFRRQDHGVHLSGAGPLWRRPPGLRVVFRYLPNVMLESAVNLR
jgi:hypothetical protein